MVNSFGLEGSGCMAVLVGMNNFFLNHNLTSVVNLLTDQCVGCLERRLKLKLDQKFRANSEQGVVEMKKNIKPVSILRKKTVI
jgi:hypothetical protein